MIRSVFCYADNVVMTTPYNGNAAPILCFVGDGFPVPMVHFRLIRQEAVACGRILKKRKR